jgi:hypothetical protein
MKPHQRALLDANPGLDPRDIPDDWHGAVDLDEQVEANRQRREAAKVVRVLPPPKAKAAPYVTQKQMDRHCETIGVFVAKVLEPLEKRIAELESRPVLSFAGTWRAASAYAKGACVQHSGGMWMARTDSAGKRPNEHASAWRLIVKRGQLTETK